MLHDDAIAIFYTPNWVGENHQVVISVFKILLHVSRPNTVVLGNIPGTQIFYNINQYKEALRVPSFLILAVESPIYFANSTYLQERLVKERFLECQSVKYSIFLSVSMFPYDWELLLLQNTEMGSGRGRAYKSKQWRIIEVHNFRHDRYQFYWTNSISYQWFGHRLT